METSTILLIAIPVLVVLAGVVLFASMRRRDTGEAIGMLSRETSKQDAGKVTLSDKADEADGADGAHEATGAEIERAAVLARTGGGDVAEADDAAAPVAWVPPDAETIGVTRRQFFNRSIIGMFAIGLTGFGAACIAFMWPQVSGGFGSAITVGKIDDVKKDIAEGNGFAYYPNGRMWITEYPASALPKAQSVYSAAELAGMEAGVVALYQKCPHLGCRVPACVTSQWFECPCHGSQYNQVGEKKGGPAPRGMDHFAMSVDGGVLTVDTGAVIQGPAIGTNTTGQEAEGPNCIGASDH